MNRGIYRLAWFQRPIGPWSEGDPAALPRRWFDRIPIFGWIGLRREAAIHGNGFWIRPLVIELSLGIGFALLYWWEMQRGLVPAWARNPAFRYPDEMILAEFFLQVLLISLMAVATFIDFDEKTIPDAITVNGTLLLLVLAAALPTSALPVVSVFLPPRMGGGVVEPLLLTSPNPWPGWLDSPRGLLLGMACLIGWCYALTPKL